MAKTLPDKEIRRLLADVISGGDPDLVNPNGIALRLGTHVRFLSTGEDMELSPGHFLKVCPGETVLISSLERIDFTRETVQKYFPNSMLMGWISPTTTMMREGISQVTTKVDAGFRGTLNWSLRNSSIKDLILHYAEPIYKLTIERLEQDERPEVDYGAGPTHQYQDTQGIRHSARRLPADIPKSKIVSSSFEKLDPKKQLREAGYPFDHIATELVELDGKFEVVSSDVRLLKDQFTQQGQQLSAKIEAESKSLMDKLKETESALLEKVRTLFNDRFAVIVGVIIGAIPIMYGGVVFLQEKTILSRSSIAFIAALSGAIVFLIAWLMSRRQK
jgi:deoxycytidine triphosphate deaminase